MEYKFQVLSVKTNLKDHNVIITCSGDVDEDTVTPETLYITHYDSQMLLPVTIECDRQAIILTSTQEVKPNEKYVLVMSSNITSVVGYELAPVKGLNILFDSNVTTNVIITEPETFTSLNKVSEVTVSWKEIGKEADLCRYYQLQIATDNAFNNIVTDTKIDRSDTTKDLSITLALKEPNQYFMRMRAIKGTDYGSWSAITTFTITGEQKGEIPNPQPDEKPRPGLPNIVDLVTNTTTSSSDDTEVKNTPKLLTESTITCDDELPTSFSFEFSDIVDISNAVVTVKRRDI